MTNIVGGDGNKPPKSAPSARLSNIFGAEKDCQVYVTLLFISWGMFY